MNIIKICIIASVLLTSHSVLADRYYESRGYDGHRFDQNGYDNSGYADEGYYEEAGYYEQGPVIVDLGGRWIRSDGGYNSLQKTYNGYFITDERRGKGVHYIEIGENLYQDANGSGVYEVIDYDYIIWRANNRSHKVIELFRR